ncbi:MAG: hypothetical protein KDB79_04975 [Acidobacteria bacterium]|nr:hypothetical protein [Acidobacteriota bacterium]
MNSKPISRKTNIVVQDLENEVLIYDLNINKAYCLNQTAGLVFQFCDGTNTVSEISGLMSSKMKKPVSDEFVWLALTELKKDDLLENAAKIKDHFSGISRREAVRRVGLASLVALPVISSLIAPNAAMAQSGCAINGAACTFAANTQSNCCNTDQRCYDSAGINPTCRSCFAPGTGPQAVCTGSGCCAGRVDANKCCSNSYTETPSGPNILCFCA